MSLNDGGKEVEKFENAVWVCSVDGRTHVIMRPSSLGVGRILRRTLSVCLSVRLSVCLSVRPVMGCRTVLRANIHNIKTSVFAYGPASRMYFSARAEGRISYGHGPSRPHKFLLALRSVAPRAAGRLQAVKRTDCWT